MLNILGHLVMYEMPLNIRVHGTLTKGNITKIPNGHGLQTALIPSFASIATVIPGVQVKSILMFS